MRGFGISVYPEQTNVQDNLNYISLAGELGYSRIFTCLLSVSSDRLKIKNSLSLITEQAHKYGMEVIADIAPSIFRNLSISYKDLSFFRELGIDGIRLDEAFSGSEEAWMTYNPYGLKIELNIDKGAHYLENVLAYKPDKHKILGCHNFYPKLYSGLSLEFLKETSLAYKKNSLRTAAFVNSLVAKVGPWSLTNGLCTLEDHRHLSLRSQAKELFYSDVIDDVIIGNAFASEKELKSFRSVNGSLITLDVSLSEEIFDIEKDILFKEIHSYRGDKSFYTIRSSLTRLKYSHVSILPHQTKPIEKGDIIVQNDFVPRYKGEVLIALMPMENDGSMNVVGKVISDDLRLLSLIEANSKFQFAIKEL